MGLRDALHVVGSDGTVSIVEIVSLSPHVKKPKSQEGNKSFVPELPRVVSVSSMHMNVLYICIFHVFVSYLYLAMLHNCMQIICIKYI